MSVLALDILGPVVRKTNDNEYIFVICDYFTKWIEAFPLKDHTALSVADKLVTEVLLRFGSATQLHTDQTPEFRSELFTNICQLPYNPKSDGFVERMNETIISMLSRLVNEVRDDWDDHLHYAMASYRATVQRSTGCTPNLLLLNRENKFPIDLMTGSPPDEKVQCYPQYIELVRYASQRAFEFAYNTVCS